IRHGAGQFIGAFDDVFRSDGTTIIRTPPYTPVAKAYAERWVGTVRRELWTAPSSGTTDTSNSSCTTTSRTTTTTGPTAPSGNARPTLARSSNIRPANRSDDTPPVADSSTSIAKRPNHTHNGQTNPATSTSTRSLPTTQPGHRHQRCASRVQTRFRHPQGGPKRQRTKRAPAYG